MAMRSLARLVANRSGNQYLVNHWSRRWVIAVPMSPRLFTPTNGGIAKGGATERDLSSRRLFFVFPCGRNEGSRPLTGPFDLARGGLLRGHLVRFYRSRKMPRRLAGRVW